MPDNSTPGEGPFDLQEMLNLLNHPGFVSHAQGMTSDLYRQHSLNYDPMLLSPFGRYCSAGLLEEVKSMVETKTAPDLQGTETPFKLSYASLVFLGSRRVRTEEPGQAEDIMKFLLASGMNPDVEDIAGLTALQYLTSSPPKETPLSLVRLLLEKGANVNHRNRFGELAIATAFVSNAVDIIDLLMEFGADLEILDADGYKLSDRYMSYGPQVAAVVRRWIRKRNGEEAPRDGKKCDQCGKDGRGTVTLQICSKFRVARYCSTDCQRAHWPTHKEACQPFSPANVVVLRPSHETPRFATAVSTADVIRNAMGHDTGPILRSNPFSQPKSLSMEAKNLIIKVQVPYGVASGDLYIYTKKRDFVATIKKKDNAIGYDRIAKVVKTRGLAGAKAYFAA